MVSAFISIYGFVTLTDAEMNELNAIRAANNLPPIQMATRVTNQEVDGAFGDVDALWFSYHLFDYYLGRKDRDIGTGRKWFSKQKK